MFVFTRHSVVIFVVINIYLYWGDPALWPEDLLCSLLYLLPSAVGRIALRSNINLCEGLSLTNWFLRKSNFVKCPIYSFANLSQLTIEYHFYKSLFALVWLVPELMIQFRGYFLLTGFCHRNRTHILWRDHPFHNFSSVSVHFEQQQSTCITKIQFYIHFCVFHPRFENLSTFEQMV